MAKPSNIRDLEHSKFVDSPTRANEAAVEVVAFVTSQNVTKTTSISEVTMPPLSVTSVSITSSGAGVRLVSQLALRWAYSVDNVNYTKVGLGGWVTLNSASSIFIKNLDPVKSNKVTIELLS